MTHLQTTNPAASPLLPRTCGLHGYVPAVVFLPLHTEITPRLVDTIQLPLPRVPAHCQHLGRPCCFSLPHAAANLACTYPKVFGSPQRAFVLCPTDHSPSLQHLLQNCHAYAQLHQRPLHQQAALQHATDSARLPLARTHAFASSLTCSPMPCLGPADKQILQTSGQAVPAHSRQAMSLPRHTHPRAQPLYVPSPFHSPCS